MLLLLTDHGCSILRELGNFEAATESFQKALLLNQNHVQTLQLRGMMLYHHGSLQEALKNFKVSLSIRQSRRWTLACSSESSVELKT